MITFVCVQKLSHFVLKKYEKGLEEDLTFKALQVILNYSPLRP